MKKPQGVEIKIVKGEEVYVKGPLGVKKAKIRGVREEGGEIRTEERATMKVIKQMIEGVTIGYKQKIKINGVGYKATKSVEGVEINLGYEEPRRVRIKKTVEIGITGNGTIIEGKSTTWGDLRQELSKIVEQRSAEKDRYKGKGVVKWKR